MFVRVNSNQGSNAGIGCLIFGVLLLVGMYYLLTGLFKLLYEVSPFLFIAAVIINWRSVADTGKSIWALVQRNPVMGLVVAGLCIVGFPLFTLYLLLKSLGYNKAQAFQQQFQDRMNPKPPAEDFVEFEELESTPKNQPKPTQPLEPPPAPEKEKPRNPYDDMFN